MQKKAVLGMGARDTQAECNVQRMPGTKRHVLWTGQSDRPVRPVFGLCGLQYELRIMRVKIKSNALFPDPEVSDCKWMCFFTYCTSFQCHG